MVNTSSTCEQLKKDYQDIAAKKQELVSMLEKKAWSGDRPGLEEVKKGKEELQARIRLLQEMLWPFEDLERNHLREQYEFQKKVFQELGIIEKLENGGMGIEAINGKEYVFPSFEEVLEMIKQNREVLIKKMKQGFNQLLIVPFGMKLGDLIEKYKKLLWKHYREKRLFALMKNKEEVPVFPDNLPFRVDTIKDIKSKAVRYDFIWRGIGDIYKDENHALWVASNYKDADIKGELVYNPKKFSLNHHGRTKKKILEDQDTGYRVIFIEDMPHIPIQDPQRKKGRTQIDKEGSSVKKYIRKGERIPSLQEYLVALAADAAYNYEAGTIPEDELVYAILYLEKHDQIIGYQDPSYQVGSYFPALDSVPYLYWSRFNQKAQLGKDKSEFRDISAGIRTVVEINKK